MGDIGVEWRELEESKVKVEVDFEKEKFPRVGEALIGQVAFYKNEVNRNLLKELFSLDRREVLKKWLYKECIKYINYFK